MTRTKLASVGFVAAHNSMQQQVLDDTKPLPNCGRYLAVRNDMRLFLRTQYPNIVHSTPPYYKVLLQYHKVLLKYRSVLQS